VLKGDLILRGGRHVAAIRKGALTRSFDSTRELFRGSLCFHVDVVAIAKAQGVRFIVATDRATGRRYAVRFADFERGAWLYSHPVFGDQLALDLSHWRRLASVGDPVQVSMFGDPSR
jgi:hypothetical protein